MLNNSNFKFSDRFEKFNSEQLLNKIIDLSINTYFEILKTKTYVKSKMIQKRENQYRDDFVETMITIQEKYGFDNLIINCEVQEKLDNADEIGFVDIKIQYRDIKNIKFVNNCYHTIECKRFGRNINLTDYYGDGILEFLNGKYSRNTNFTAMICFIEEFRENNTIDDIVVKINKYLNRKSISPLIKIQNEKYDYIYVLKNPNFYNGEIIFINHLMFDYSNIYSNN